MICRPMLLVIFSSCLLAVTANGAGAAAPIEAGDLVVTVVSAPVMDAEKTLMTATAGNWLVARETQDTWVLVDVSAEEETVTGWINSAYLGRSLEKPEQIWLISTRHASSCSMSEPNGEDLHHWQLGADSQWLPANRQKLLESDDANTPTCFFVHGNRVGRQQAVHDAWMVYRHFKRIAPDRPLRFVIWSWPADRIGKRNRPDVQTKAARADQQSLHLAKLLSEIDPQVSIGLVGYSFGARAIAGACHILGGGRVAGRGLQEPAAARLGSMRAVLVAAAMGSDWLLEGRRHGLALDRLNALLITSNRSDTALRWYPRMYRHQRGPDALGFTGPTCVSCLQEAQEKVATLNVTRQVGRTHEWSAYFYQSNLRSRLDWYAFFTRDETDQVASLTGQESAPGPTRPTASDGKSKKTSPDAQHQLTACLFPLEARS